MDKLMKLNIQMFAEPADNDSIDDEIDTEVADGDIDNIDDVDDVDDESSENEDGDNDDVDNQPVTPNVEAANIDKTKAFSKRLGEEKTKIEQANKAKMDEIARNRGFKDWEALEAYDKQERINNMGITDAPAFDSYVDEKVNNHPAIIAAKQFLEQERAKQRTEVLDTEIKEINKVDPSIKSLDDLVQIENYADFEEKVKKGYSLSDAYKLTNFDKLSDRQAKSASQKVLNNIDNKGHLKTSTGKGAEEVFVPKDVMEMYRLNLPGWTKEQIQKDYAKRVAEGGNEDE